MKEYKNIIIFVLFMFTLTLFLNIFKSNINYRENYEDKDKKKFRAITVTTTSDNIVTSDSNGNLNSTTINNLTQKGINIGQWGIYSDSSKNLCFIRTDLDNVDPICMNGNTISNGGGMITSPRNSVKAWVIFKASSFIDTKDIHNFNSITDSAVIKNLTSKKTGSGIAGWDDGFNIKNIERKANDPGHPARPDTYIITFITPMTNENYAVYLGQGDAYGVAGHSWLNVLGINKKTTNYVEITIKGDATQGGAGGAIASPWWERATNRDFIMNVMIYQ